MTIKDPDQFYSCLQLLTFSKEEMILDTQMLDYHTMQYTSIPAQWRRFLQVFNHGQCQTVRSLGQLTDSVQVMLSLQKLCRNCAELNASVQVKISLNASLPYRIWLHDPDFFLVTWNPSSVPAVEITLDLDTATTGFQYIGVEELRHLDRDGAPCTDYQEEGASFSDCVVTKMVESVGCKVTLNNIILTMINDNDLNLTFCSTSGTILKTKRSIRIAQQWKILRNTLFSGYLYWQHH